MGKGGKQSKPEKKSRKAMQKLGMKPVPGVERVTIKKSKNVRSLLYFCALLSDREQGSSSSIGQPQPPDSVWELPSSLQQI
jgi:hypothetical protein